VGQQRIVPGLRQITFAVYRYENNNASGKNGLEEKQQPHTDRLLSAAILDLGQKQVQRLDTMTLPAVLEPVRSYLLAYLRFSLDLERARFRYIKDGDVPPLRELFAATCRSSKPEDASMFANLAAAPQTARPAASGHGWHNRMIDCRASEGSYPIASWQAFVRNYGLKETSVDSH
jgi:hypothetical protein